MYTLIGDIVGSRKLRDRTSAQHELGEALARVNARLAAVQPLEPTVGDEIQGGYSSIADVTLAALLLRLEVLPTIDMRFGIGLGEITVHDRDRAPLLQDGPGWWAAREAIAALDGKRGSRFVGPDDALVNAYLLARDGLVDRLGDRPRRMLLHALHGHSQRSIASLEGITESAVSQAFARGIRAVHDAQLLLGRP